MIPGHYIARRSCGCVCASHPDSPEASAEELVAWIAAQQRAGLWVAPRLGIAPEVLAKCARHAGERAAQLALW